MNKDYKKLLEKQVLEETYSKVIKQIKESKLVYKMQQKKKIEYYNIPISFDIESSSFYENGEKRCIMYIWQMCFLLDDVILGRSWLEWHQVIDALVQDLDLSLSKRIVIYVHNLSYEFQFIRKHFDWFQVFALDERKVAKAVTTSGIEFRCSYIQSSKSLENLGKSLIKYPVEKMSGDLDYNLLRHSSTPLTNEELGYCVNDVRVVNHYIQERIESGETINKIVLTNTGYVREYCRKNTLQIGSARNYNYINLMKRLTLEADEYELLKSAFSGGFTHSNVLHSRELVSNVTSYDFTSSYPAVMLSEMFPMSKGTLVVHPSRNTFYRLIQYYNCVFRIRFTNLRPKANVYENYISKSKCFELKNYIENNGRIVQAEVLATCITEVDFEVIDWMYDWDAIQIKDLYYYRKRYLPKEFVECILKFYEDKTTLKGVAGREEDYTRGKGMLNSCYGMAVTDIARPDIIYNEEWDKNFCNINETIQKENAKHSRFLFYPWGVWVTAYARRNLFTGIKEFGSDLVYCDTDSLKVLNIEKHNNYISSYNAQIEEKLRKAMKYHEIDFSRCKPKTIKGEEKLIGIWDYDGFYNRFKTLGAKRYMVEKNEKLDLTISGVNKKIAIPYLTSRYSNDVIFKMFDDEMIFPAEATGKNTHTYIDEEQSGEVVDYLGNKNTYHELSSVHMEATEYSLSMSNVYLDYILGFKEDFIVYG